MTEHGILNRSSSVKFWLITWKQWQTSGRTLNCSQLLKGELPYPLTQQMMEYNAERKLTTHSYEIYNLSDHFKEGQLQLVELDKPVDIEDPAE